MHWLRTHTQKSTRVASTAEAEAASARHKETLYWIALVITGKTKLAEESIVDAVSLAPKNSDAFRVWLANWALSATTRVALNAVGSSIQETAAQYADSDCSHRKHEPLSPRDTDSLHELDPYKVIQQLDVLARSVLVVCGCQRMSVAECALFLRVPLRCAVGAYCRALQWYGELAEPADNIADSLGLHFLRRDPDGVPVWSTDCPSAA